MAQESKRVLLKLSGEALGREGWLFDAGMIGRVAGVLCTVASRGTQLAVVIGGGNLWRGRQAEMEMDLVAADQMGMLATVINCLYMADAIRQRGMSAQVLSALEMPRVCEVYRADLANRYLEQGQIVLLAGGLGAPCFTTDTAVALRAAELGADAVLLAKNVDGVYTKDPKEDPSATLIRDITYREAIDRRLKAMDTAAFAICAEQRLPLVRVFGLAEPENILSALDNPSLGTTLHP